MFIGIDLGTSSIKCVLVDADERVIAAASEALEVTRPAPSSKIRRHGGRQRWRLWIVWPAKRQSR